MELRPPGSGTSFGDEAVELAGRAGLLPDEWQAEALHDLLMLGDDGLWSAREAVEIVGRQEGKTTHIALPRAVVGALLLGEQQIMWSSHELKTSRKSFEVAQVALERLGERVSDNLLIVDGRRVAVRNTNSQEGFVFEATDQFPRQEWLFPARSAGAGRGFPGDLNVIDEAFAYTRVQQQALAPTALAMANPQTIYLSSPPLDGKSGEVLFSLLARAQRRARRLYFRAWGIPNTLDELAQLEQREGEDALRALLQDRDLWYSALPALAIGRVSERNVEDLFEQMDLLGFAREVLGAWPVQVDDASRVLTGEMMRRTAVPDGRMVDEGPFAYGIDCTPDRSTSAIGVAGPAAGRSALGRPRVQVEVIEHRAGLGWVVERAVEIDAKRPGLAWVVDGASPAKRLVPDLEANGLLVRVLDSNDAADAATGLYDAFAGETATVQHLDDRVLNTAAGAARKRNVGDGRFAWGRRSSTSSIAPLVAVTDAWFVIDGWLRTPPPPPLAVPSTAGDAGAAPGSMARVSF